MDINTVKKRLKAVIRGSRLLNSFIKSLTITLGVFFISYILYYMLGSRLTMLQIDSSNLSYLHDYYEKKNQSNSHYENADDIYILCADDTIARDSLAKIIETVFDYSPKVVGIDILFKDNKDGRDKNLIKSIRNHSDSIVLAQVIDDDGYFFPNLLDEEDSLQFGIVNSYDILEFPDSFYSVNNKQYRHFAYEISKKYLPDLAIDSKVFLINFSNTHFTNTDVDNFLNDPDSVKTRHIEGKIVLIGNSDSPFDIHPMPFMVDGQTALSGIERHAYAINSLISQEHSLKRLSVCSGQNVLFYILIILLYSFLYVILVDKQFKYVREFESALTIIRPLVLLIIVPLLLYGVYIYTEFGNIIPNMVPFLISVFVINTFNDFLSQKINSQNNE